MELFWAAVSHHKKIRKFFIYLPYIHIYDFDISSRYKRVYCKNYFEWQRRRTWRLVFWTFAWVASERDGPAIVKLNVQLAKLRWYSKCYLLFMRMFLSKLFHRNFRYYLEKDTITSGVCHLLELVKYHLFKKLVESRDKPTPVKPPPLKWLLLKVINILKCVTSLNSSLIQNILYLDSRKVTFLKNWGMLYSKGRCP